MPGKKNSAFNAPPSDGTSNQARAARWENASQDRVSSSASGSGFLSTDNRSASPGQPRKSDSQRSERSSRGNTRDSSRGSSRSRGKKAKISQEFFVEWFGNPGDREPEPGKLSVFADPATERTGMSNPPQNPEVQNELLEYLSSRKVAAKVDPKRHLRKSNLQRVASMPAGNRAAASRALGGQAAATSAADRSLMPAAEQATNGYSLQREDTFTATAPAGFGHTGGSGSRAASPSVGTRASITGRRSSMTNDAKKNKKEEMREFLVQMQKERKNAPRILDESEVRWKRSQLRLQAREHGFVLDKKELEDVAELAMYNNKMSRSLTAPHSKGMMATVGPGGTLVMVPRGSVATDKLSHAKEMANLKQQLEQSMPGAPKRKKTGIKEQLTEEFFEPVVQRLKSTSFFGEIDFWSKLGIEPQQDVDDPYVNAGQDMRYFDDEPGDFGSTGHSISSRAPFANAMGRMGSKRAMQGRAPSKNQSFGLGTSASLGSLGTNDSFAHTSDSFASWSTAANSRASTRESGAPPTAKRLLEMAEKVKISGPNRLQAMAQAARISVLTGRKLPDPPPPLAAPSRDKTYRGLSRGASSVGADWRPDFPASDAKRGGRQLPVPQWGRTGSAPTLLEASAAKEF